MQKKHFTLLLSLVLLLSMLTPFGGSSTQAANDLLVGVDELNLRSGPGLSYSVTASLQRGEVLTSLDREGDWIQVSNGQTKGWVASWLVVANTKEGAASTTNGTKVIVAQVDNLNIRSDAAISASVLGQLSAGSQAVALQEKFGWIQIEYNGKKGWVSQDYVTVKTSTEKPATSAAGLTFTIQIDTLNVREEPSLNSKKLSTVKRGQVFNVLKQEDLWIQIEYASGKKGWIYSFYGALSNGKNRAAQPTAKDVQTIYNGTNLRTGPSTDYAVVARIDAGQTLTTTAEENGWYKVTYNGQPAFISSTVVKSANAASNGAAFSGLTIVVDAGHGGHDGGTVGARHTLEKKLNLEVATKLASKLRANGANVVLTRDSDTYVSLPTRVSISHQYAADAVISIHHDAHIDRSVRGFTTYYSNDFQKPLAQAINRGLQQQLQLSNRGTQYGDYYITRENNRHAVLVELGYLSNGTEEQILRSNQFQEQAAYGIYVGLLNYF